MTRTVRSMARRVRAIASSWAAEPSLRHLEAIRAFELAFALTKLPATGRLLEIGAGTGWQAKRLEARGFIVQGIDVPSSNYRESRVWPVVEYDGVRIPFEDHSFDVIFSSNTLEHIPHVREFQAEIHRVLAPGGVVLHLVPSASWRFWTSLTHLARWWRLPRAHGEHARGAWEEIGYFRRSWWSDLFRQTGWRVVHAGGNGLFYTGTSVLDRRLPLAIRARTSAVLGSSCNVFLLREDAQS